MAAANSHGQGGGRGRGRGWGRGASNLTRGSSVPLIKQEPLSDAPEIISDEDCQVLDKGTGREENNREANSKAWSPISRTTTGT